MSKTAKILVVCLLALLLLSSCGLWQTYEHPNPKVPSQLPAEFQTLGEVWGLLYQNYVEPEALNSKQLSQGAIKGMLEALGDPYTSYLDPETYKLASSSFQGEFEGIGATVGIRDGQLVVVSPLPDSPAERAGLRPGDKVLEINGEPTSKMNLEQAVLKIRGPKGEKVKLLVEHEGADTPIELEIVRAEIKSASVSTKLLENDIGYLRLTFFSERTGQEMKQALDDLLGQGARSLVIDLRDNPGGLVQTVVDVATQFLDGGVVLYEVNRQGERKEWMAQHGGMATQLPLAVLVNQHSASGSEVLAGALQDRGRAPLIGTTTFGKGSVNVLYPLKDGSALYLTIERWLTPNGRPIEGKGLEPDFLIEPTPDDIAQGKDPQLQQAIDYLQAKLAPALPQTAALSEAAYLCYN
jgi:carboxyl-terminal processing protease